MNDKNQCEMCDKSQAHQTFTATSKLLNNEGSFEAGEKCHTDMYSYKELPENIKDYDRVTVTAVLTAISDI